MSSIAVQGGATGTGLVTVVAPSTSINRTLTLPDVTATVITDSAGVLNIGSGQVYKDASGNVGIGTSSPDRRLAVQTPAAGASLGSNAVVFSDFATATMELKQSTTQNQWSSNTAMSFATSGAEAIRIDSSRNVLVNTTSQNDSAQFSLTVASGKNGIGMSVPSTAETGNVIFRNPNGVVGRIYTSGSNTSYATSSDYRLKEAIAPMTGALAKVSLLKPCTYKWKVDGSDGQGFIAHELAEVEAGCVTGEKDAMDAEGNPQYQGIDTSFLVATLTAAIQELKALVDTQAARITALEATA